MELFEIIYKNILEGLFFFLVIIILFNSLTDFAHKINITAQTLELQQIRYFGFLSCFLAILNLLSNKFFGFTLVR